MGKLDELRALIGKTVRVSAEGDLWMNGDLRPILNTTGLGPPVTLVKVTKGGNAIVSDGRGRQYSVPPRNVYPAEEAPRG